jgi:hypothetical protein
VAELVDAADSKSAVRKGVKVRFLSWAPRKKPSLFEKVFIFYSFYKPNDPTTLPEWKICHDWLF